MKYFKWIAISLVILSFVFSGCVEDTPDESPSPTATETVEPTIVPTATITPSPIPTPVRIPAVYKSDVDNYYGFRRIVNMSSNLSAPHDVFNRTLTIYAGDTVIWVNDADDPEEKLTIISEQGLWDNNSAILRWRFKEFNYTFTRPGTYSVYMKEYPGIQHQTIIVNK